VVYGSRWPVWGKLRAGWGGADGTHETYETYGGPVARVTVFVGGLGANGGGLGRPDA
jgi:hypothetical protein